MANHQAEKYLEHCGHHIEIVTYGVGEIDYNVSIECEDCNVVLTDEEV